jgi:hypothetical protein
MSGGERYRYPSGLISRGDGKQAHVFEIEISDSGLAQIKRAAKVLAGISGGIYRAVGSAGKRAMDHGKTVGMKIVSEEYAIGQNELKRHTRNINTVIKNDSGAIEVTFGYRGYVIPLMRFDTRIGKDGRVETRVLRSATRKSLDHAFKAKMGGHTGIYERTGPGRFPVEELFGPSAVQAFWSRKEVYDKVQEEVNTTFDKRIDHEILRVLNGWGT